MAGGVGITLTAGSHVIFQDLDWVPANHAQAEDRCYRLARASAPEAFHAQRQQRIKKSAFVRIAASIAPLNTSSLQSLGKAETSAHHSNRAHN